MKKLAIVLVALSLSGCALFDAYFMAKYDNQEYQMANKIRTMAQVSIKNCDSPKEIKVFYVNVWNASTEFKNYTEHLPRNPEAHKMAVQLEELIDRNAKAYGSSSQSVVFCKLQLQQIERSADKIQTVLGSKPR